MSAPAAIPVQKAREEAAFRGPVLFVIPGDGQGSSMIFARRQADILAGEGLEMKLFFLRSRTSPRCLLAEFWRFRGELTRFRPALVHAHFGTVTALFSALASGSMPLVITYRGGDLNSPPKTSNWRTKIRSAAARLCSQLAALRAREIVCVSGRLRNRLWWRRGAVTILPTGVDPDVFRPEARASVRQRLGWSEAERVVLFNAGYDAQGKRLDLALAAIERAREKCPDVRLEILDGSVPPERIPDLMNAADCLLLTSVSEGSPTVVQEALGCNLPVVSVDVGDVRERLQGVRDSIVCAADAETLGRALAKLLEPPRRSNGRSKLNEFSAVLMARALREIYGKAARA